MQKNTLKLVSVLGAALLGLFVVLFHDSKLPSHTDHNHAAESRGDSFTNTSTGVGVERETIHSPPSSPSNLAAEMTALINQKLNQEGGRVNSLAYLERLTAEFVESRKRAPFETILAALKKNSSVELPSQDFLWTLSIESMRYITDLLSHHNAWLLERSSAPIEADSFPGIRNNLRIQSLKLPPEAIAMGLTNVPWDSIVRDYPDLNHSLGHVREAILLKYSILQEEIWITLTAANQAAIELGIDLSDRGDLPRALAQYYPPLFETIQSMDDLHDEYRNQIAGELIAAGLDVSLP